MKKIIIDMAVPKKKKSLAWKRHKIKINTKKITKAAITPKITIFKKINFLPLFGSSFLYKIKKIIFLKNLKKYYSAKKCLQSQNMLLNINNNYVIMDSIFFNKNKKYFLIKWLIIFLYFMGKKPDLKKLTTILFYKNYISSSFLKSNNKLFTVLFNYVNTKKIFVKNDDFFFYRSFFKKIKNNFRFYIEKSSLNTIPYLYNFFVYNFFLKDKKLILNLNNDVILFKPLEFCFFFKLKLNKKKFFFTQFFFLITKKNFFFANFFFLKKTKFTYCLENKNLSFFKNNIKYYAEKLHKKDFLKKSGFVSHKYFIFLNIFKKNNLNIPVDSNQKNIFFNNWYPFFKKNNFVFKRLKLKRIKRKNVNVTAITHKILLPFLKSVFDTNFFIKFDTNYFVKYDTNHFNRLKYLEKIFKNVNSMEFKAKEFIDIIIYTMFLKDIKLLSDYLLLIYETTPEKTHKKFTLTLKNVFQKNFEYFKKNFGIVGFHMDFKGKINAVKNAKKGRIVYTLGKIKASKKSLRIDYQYKTVVTLGGTLGFTLAIAF